MHKSWDHLKPLIMITCVLSVICIDMNKAYGASHPFSPGEKLKYALRWENIPAGEIVLETKPITTYKSSPVYHFVMTVKSNATIDLFCKIRDRIDAYADMQMTRSVYYQKERLGNKEVVTFNWSKQQVQFADAGTTHRPIDLTPGSFDPLSAFYYTRMAISDKSPQIKRPVTDGKRRFIGKAKLVGRETITLSNGKSYDTWILEPDMGLLSESLKENKDARLHVWVTADHKRIPVQIKTKVKVGHLIGELVSAQGV